MEEMQESVLSARRSPPCLGEEDVDDESKTRTHASFAARISKNAHLGSGSHCLVVSVSLLVLLLVACFLFSRSRPVICVSAYDSIARNARSVALIPDERLQPRLLNNTRDETGDFLWGERDQ